MIKINDGKYNDYWINGNTISNGRFVYWLAS